MVGSAINQDNGLLPLPRRRRRRRCLRPSPPRPKLLHLSPVAARGAGPRVPPGAPSSGEGELVRAALNATARRVGHALYGAASALVGGGAARRRSRPRGRRGLRGAPGRLPRPPLPLPPLPLLSRSRSRSRPASDDVRTWLSAALTNQDTCEEGLDAIRDRRTRIQLQAHFIDLRTLLSSALAVFAAAGDSGEFSGIPIQDKKKAKRVLLRAANTDDDGRKSDSDSRSG
uniref:Pectinesterase inhibitor domain-containing protein n=1 Tax=Ananas comosus var. bracteatus TaxID=296719 RepID=A0A6V7Q8E8_ANACO|nr:unnamed protein product [Ananas comosus var. bracteatus]